MADSSKRSGKHQAIDSVTLKFTHLIVHSIITYGTSIAILNAKDTRINKTGMVFVLTELRV